MGLTLQRLKFGSIKVWFNYFVVPGTQPFLVNFFLLAKPQKKNVYLEIYVYCITLENSKKQLPKTI